MISAFALMRPRCWAAGRWLWQFWASKRELLMQGIKSCVYFLWDSKGCPVFAGRAEDGSAASAFLNMLCELDIADKNFRLGSFDLKDSASRNRWREVLGLRDRREFEWWEVPFNGENSVRPWLGIKPTFRSETSLQSPGLFGFRFLMVMSFIVLHA
jgi:hypothetical protein